jgi:membrane-bound metal-dependent hydrolase YbcI (DUF457 family)
MYPVGHVVIGCAAVWAGSHTLERSETAFRGTSHLAGLASRIDYRWVALGALLPDLIDKPITWSGILGDNTGGHFIGHALMFQVGLLLFGLLLARQGRWGLALVAIGALSHIAADATTHVPRTVLWPFVTIPPSWNSTVVGATNIAGELIGSIIVLWFFYVRYRDGRLPQLLRSGTI